MRLTVISVFLLTLSLISSCVSKPGVTADNRDSVVLSFDIPRHGLSYGLPYPQRTIVAPRESLTDKVSMCVVDTTADVSVLLLNLQSFPQNYSEAEKTVQLVSRQSDVEYATSSSYDIRECEFLDTCAWNFDVSLVVRTAADSIGVKFYGYLFENMAFVVTAPASDSITVDKMTPYITGLKRSDGY